MPDRQNKPTWSAFWVADIRKRERRLLGKAGLVQSGNSALAPIASTMAIVLTFTGHILLRRRLTAAVVRAPRLPASMHPDAHT